MEKRIILALSLNDKFTRSFGARMGDKICPQPDAVRTFYLPELCASARPEGEGKDQARPNDSESRSAAGKPELFEVGLNPDFSGNLIYTLIKAIKIQFEFWIRLN